MIEYHVIGKVMEEKMQIMTIQYRYSQPIINSIDLPCEDISKHMYFFNTKIAISHGKVNVFKEYKECFVIESEKEFKDYDILRYKDKDYKVSYKYNEDEKQHQLYIDYEIEIVKLDDDFIKKCDDNYKFLMEFRKSYMEKQRQELEKKDEIKNESKGFFYKLKKFIKKKG